jgi:hypothetical protein
MPAAAASAGDIGDVIRVIGGLGNRVPVSRNCERAGRAAQTHRRCNNYRKHHKAHVDSSSLTASKICHRICAP